MSELIRKTYDEQLKTLDEMFVKLGRASAEAFSNAIAAVENNDSELAEQVIENDITINNMEVEIETYAVRIISLQQPIGIELRKIVSILKASSDLERIADHAVSIAKSVRRVDELNIRPLAGELKTMGETAHGMVMDAIDAFISNDPSAAQAVADRDEEVDANFKRLLNDLVKEMQKDQGLTEIGTSYASTLSNIERIGDYATNICEWTVYNDKAKLVELNK